MWIKQESKRLLKSNNVNVVPLFAHFQHLQLENLAAPHLPAHGLNRSASAKLHMLDSGKTNTGSSTNQIPPRNLGDPLKSCCTLLHWPLQLVYAQAFYKFSDLVATLAIRLTSSDDQVCTLDHDQCHWCIPPPTAAEFSFSSRKLLNLFVHWCGDVRSFALCKLMESPPLCS